MRRFTLAAGIACAILLTNHAGAQNPGGTSSASTSTLSAASVGGFMPGQIVSSQVGRPFPVGTTFPSAAPLAGMPITPNGQMRPYDPKNPYAMFKGTDIDPKQVLAPLVGADGKPIQQPDALDAISDNIKAFFTRHTLPPRPPFVPGIYRRDRERVQQMWRRD